MKKWIIDWLIDSNDKSNRYLNFQQKHKQKHWNTTKSIKQTFQIHFMK